jgi:hypothetical protein
LRARLRVGLLGSPTCSHSPAACGVFRRGGCVSVRGVLRLGIDAPSIALASFCHSSASSNQSAFSYAVPASTDRWRQSSAFCLNITQHVAREHELSQFVIAMFVVSALNFSLRQAQSRRRRGFLRRNGYGTGWPAPRSATQPSRRAFRWRLPG